MTGKHLNLFGALVPEGTQCVVNSRSFWIYLAAATLVAAGFDDFQVIACHFQKVEPFRAGIGVLVPLTIVSALFAPLVFFGGFWPAVLGTVGLGEGRP
jgi:hypothetical protein